VFVGAFQHVLGRAGELLIADSPKEGFQRYLSLQKVAVLDIGLHSDVLIHERQRIIGRQSEAIRELSTPVLQVRERLLLLPLIGVIDTHRTKLITENLLRAVRDTRAKVVVMDVTGVATIDSKVANHLVQTVTAARLMGAHTIVSGVTAEVAQSMVALGIEMTPFKTVGDLQGGLEDAERLLGFEVTRVEG
jgi:rsbT co-antagonist protein RsbR